MTTPAATTLLIVDDDPQFSYLMQRYADASGCHSLVAHEGELALTFARSHHPALILLELGRLPGPGWQILSRLKGDQATANIPVAVCGALVDQERVVGEGADFYLWKPVMYDDFLRVLLCAGLAPQLGPALSQRSGGGALNSPT